MGKPSPANSSRDSSSQASGSADQSRNGSAFAAGGGMAVTGVLLLVLGVGTYALFQMDSFGDGAGGEAKPFQLDLADQMSVPEELLAYSRTQVRETALKTPTAIAVGPDGTVYVGGDRAVEILSPDGASAVMELEYSPTCLAIGRGEQSVGHSLYVGAGRHVLVLGPGGEVKRQWAVGDAKTTLTAIAVTEEDVFVADAGRRVVVRFDTAGKVLGTIGESDPERRMPGFVIPSAYFDLALGPDHVLHVVNPGMRRVEAYNLEGQLQSYWGRAGPALPNFFGCCNPAHLAMMPDGRFVTSEKGVPRVKVYSSAGEFQHVVAGPRQLDVDPAALGDARGNQSERVFDVAVDGTDRVMVLDPRQRRVLVFTPQGEGGAGS